MNVADQLAGLFGQVTQDPYGGRGHPDMTHQQKSLMQQEQMRQSHMQQMQNQQSLVSQSEYREALRQVSNAIPQQSGKSEPEFNPVVLLL